MSLAVHQDLYISRSGAVTANGCVVILFVRRGLNDFGSILNVWVNVGYAVIIKRN